jgi:hypothetical protein
LRTGSLPGLPLIAGSVAACDARRALSADKVFTDLK